MLHLDGESVWIQMAVRVGTTAGTAHWSPATRTNRPRCSSVVDGIRFHIVRALAHPGPGVWSITHTIANGTSELFVEGPAKTWPTDMPDGFDCSDPFLPFTVSRDGVAGSARSHIRDGSPQVSCRWPGTHLAVSPSHRRCSWARMSRSWTGPTSQWWSHLQGPNGTRILDGARRDRGRGMEYLTWNATGVLHSVVAVDRVSGPLEDGV